MQELTRTPRGRKPRATVLQTESRGWLSIDEAADFMATSKPKVWRLIGQGEFGYHHEGGQSKIKLRVCDLEAYMMRHWRRPVPAATHT